MCVCVCLGIQEASRHRDPAVCCSTISIWGRFEGSTLNAGVRSCNRDQSLEVLGPWSSPSSSRIYECLKQRHHFREHNDQLKSVVPRISSAVFLCEKFRERHGSRLAGRGLYSHTSRRHCRYNLARLQRRGATGMTSEQLRIPFDRGNARCNSWSIKERVFLLRCGHINSSADIAESVFKRP